jgi:predicted nucleic acid-binding protein
MSSELPRAFVDTNILVYAFDASAGVKQKVAQALLLHLWDTKTGCLSVQILQEFFNAVTRKIPKPLSIDEAAPIVSAFSTWPVFAPTEVDVLAAIALCKQAQLSFWDAMLVRAAAESRCVVLWTEDLNDGQVIEGVQIRNPFSGN